LVVLNPDVEPSDDDLLHVLTLIDKLGKVSASQIQIHIEIGLELAAIKKGTKHGEFMERCRRELNRSQSWEAIHLRLANQTHHLEHALAWARAVDHEWAHRHSVERLLKLISEYTRKVRGQPGVKPRREMPSPSYA
jgi:hypothetical protein